MKTFIISFLLILIPKYLDAKGTVTLDSLTFDKVLSKFQSTLVKLDVAYPYGPKHDEFVKFAESVHNVDNLLIAEVGVKDYGEKDNEDLAKRLNAVDKEKYPVVRLFVHGKPEPYDFLAETDEDFTVDRLRSFVKLNNKDIYIGAPGCYEHYDKIAKKFSNEKNVAERKEILLEAEGLWDKAEGFQEQKSAEIYVKTMRKIIEKGDKFTATERARINKILKGDVVNEKRQDFTNRLNILDSFSLVHDEL